ncbi:pyridoxamine 5'-phosphate oxidase family protein [Ahrensia sp. R2A130]|uniref:pyridoxamine 5'-phosphate oxidase family protein n=1 Tax=Ahrensia sp. R2A130 TaxID=744979 RepID=UPI0001E09C1D|nr:pyridoxamine 5'-phosphate oxidase family protein [Ahrensia sp. R2A130]EFL90620.1 signal transduction histidine kinase, nitrogen specific [Ahrensia sp. R2A130]
MPTAQRLNPTLTAFIEKQPVFFVATAGRDGRVNVSPKGMGGMLHVVDRNKIVWLNVTGSGNETAAHVQENGRMTLMFCAFEGDALILRVYGNANVLHPHDAGWDEAITRFPETAGNRQIFSLDIDLVQTSCGTGVPLMDFVKSRGEDELLPFYEDMGRDGVRDYWKRKNLETIDGEPTGLLPSTTAAG